MAEIITMPRLSDTMEEGTVVKWYKKLGESVKEGDILAEIETDKATQEFESDIEGILLHIGIPEGASTTVDSVLAIIGTEGEDISMLLSQTPSTKKEESLSNKNTEANQTKEQSSSSFDLKTEKMPEGVEIITMPRLSDTMEEGTVVKWYKKLGESVKEGDILAEIETDKATQEFESDIEGVILHIGIPEGASTTVDSVLAIIGPKGTNIEPFLTEAITNPDKNKRASLSLKENKNDVVSEQTSVGLLENTTTSNLNQRILASPLARKMAKEKGIDLSKLIGSGENSRIIKKDIENYKPSEISPQIFNNKLNNDGVSFLTTSDLEVPISNIRKVIAKRLSESKFTAPHYYLFVEADMTQTMVAREKINTLTDTKVSFNDIIIKSTAAALQKHPTVNSSWEKNYIIEHGGIHIGVAVAVSDGLVVPVVQHADKKSITQIATEVKDLAMRARDKKLKANEMQGSTFSISNLGMFGIESFTSIINQPNSAILSVGTIVEKAVVREGAIVVGHTMKLTLACDHRVVDGATGAAFLKTLKHFIENPITMLA